MKFACVMVTRGRPQKARAALEIAKTLASGKHELDIIVCLDDDDLESQQQLGDYRRSIAPSPAIMGDLWNRGAALIEGADVICPLIDDAFISCPSWDDRIARIFESAPPNHRLLGWNDQANKGLLTLPIMGADWYKAAGLYPSWFPYWFYDTWVAEVYSFVNGALPFIPPELLLAANKGQTQRMRDLGFWWNFYSALRPMRLQEAERLREHFGISVSRHLIDAAINYWENRDRHFMGRIPELESLTDKTSQLPSEKYMITKAIAEEKLADLARVRMPETGDA